MGSAGAARQLLRWAARTTAFRFGPHPLGRLHLFSTSTFGPLRSERRVPPTAPVSKTPSPQLSLQSLVNLGFTENQAEEIHGDVVAKFKPENAARYTLPALATLFLLGLNAASVQKVLHKCPELCVVKETLLQQRIGHLRKLGLGEGSLQRVVAHCPQILTVSVKALKRVEAVLRERCLFTAQQATDIFRDSPAIALEDPAQIEYKFQYVYFRMGIKQGEIIKSRLFRVSLEELCFRHCFLERRGLFQTPDKKGQTVVLNPKLDSIIHVDGDTFLSAVAKASEEEYDVFQRLMAREWREKDHEFGRVIADGDDDGDDEEEGDHGEEDLETPGRKGYMKRRKK